MEDPNEQTEALLPKDNEEADESINDMNLYSMKTQEILQNSINAVKFVIVCAVMADFTYSSRFSVWYLYANQFDDSTPITIVWVLYAGFFTICIVGLFFPWMSDSIGYDKVMVIMLITSTIGILGESIAMNFIFLSVFFVISQVEIFAISLAYIAWILPHKYAVEYTTKLYSFMVIGYLSGPILAGLLSYFVSYRSVFWINFGLNILVLIMALRFILNKQHKLENDQISLIDEFNESELDKDYIFPTINEQNNDENFDKSSFAIFFKSLSLFQWIQISNVIIQNGLVLSLEALLVTYYPTFMINYFGENNLIAYFQLVVICIGFIVGNGMVPVLIDPETKIIYPLNNKYFILIVSLILNIILLQIVYPLIINVHIFWITNLFYGIFFGITAMVQEVFILEMQPTQHAGKINGIKGLMRHLIPAIAILIAGILITENDEYSIFYVSSGCLVLSFILAIIMIVMDCFKKNEEILPPV